MYSNLKRAISRVMAFVMVISCCFSSVIVTAQAAERNIDVWDFGFAAESGAYYTNNITQEKLNAELDAIGATGGLVPADCTSTSMSFGDLTLMYTVKDRFYNTGSNTYGTPGKKYSDSEYTSNGYYYCNGTGGDGRRCFIVENVKAGDTLIIYSGWSNSPSDPGDSVCCVSGTVTDGVFTADGVQSETSEPSTGITKNFFIAQEDGAYKLYMSTSNSGKPVTFRVVRVPSVTVSGTVTGELPASYGIKFQNNDTGDEIAASVADGKYTVQLPTGYNYTAVMTDVIGYGFTIATKKIATAYTDIATGAVTANLVSEVKSSYTLSGKVNGFADGYDTSKLGLTFTPTDNEEAETVNASVDGAALTYSVMLDSGVTYAVSVSGVNDYDITDGSSYFYDGKETARTQDITVGAKALYNVSGEFLGLTQTRGEYEKLNINPTAITFTNADDNYKYSGTIENGAYSGSLRNGSYSVEITDDSYSTTNHIVVNGGAVTKDILCKYDGPVAEVPYAADVYVGAAREYTTLQSAIDAISAMNRTDGQRVTVHIDPGTYRAQTIINTPNVTLINDSEDEDVVLTWYYGIGYKYYSCHNGYYDPYYDYDQYVKEAATKWGAATYVKEGGKGFKAENIYFEASFNKYMTDEEIADGVEITGDESITFKRTISAEVTTKDATERSSAFAIEADDSEFLNCTFYGSQDTLYTGSKDYDEYYKNCKIIGQTDYIFGDGNCVFDGCELQWAGYSAGSVGGYVTAAKDTASNGYLFRGCTITGQQEENEKMIVSSGNFGRPWGAGAKVAFINTKLAVSDYITASAWGEMSNNKPENANFVEYNTTYNGGAVSVSGRKVTPLTELDTSKYNALSYLNGFVPTYYTEDLGTVPVFKTEPYFTSNGDLNAPTIGNTFYVNYDLGDWADTDVSRIAWYRVDADGNETLIKTTTSNIETSYQAQRADAGYYLKVCVQPATIDGALGEKFFMTTEFALGSNWVDPSNPDEPEPGTGINVYLAGDSTVKDYSANGMYMGGKIEDKGSWGEFLQEFLDKDYVTVLNYANGGRSTRNFINEGSLDKIKANIKEGDYFLIQFGHNDCSNSSGYLADRYVPLGEPDSDGIYPTNPPNEGYTQGNYTYDCGATFKWYLTQYINAARDVGATPVLVTPVSRRQFDSNGKIKPHHDSTDTTTGTYVSSGNAYVQAYYQLAKEENVMLIDGFELTKTLLEKAYADDPDAKNGMPYVMALFCTDDGTHYSKTGGVLQAGLFANAIKELDTELSKYVIAPKSCEGLNNTGTMFTVSTTGKFTANDNNYNYSAYWTEYGQALFDSLETNEPVVDDNPYDVNGDGVTDKADAQAVLQHYLDKTKDLPTFNAEKADVNKDGTITALDASLLEQIVLDAK